MQTPKRSDWIIRKVAFYFCTALFLILLPIVLSYALGYKIDYHALKIYKTGILYIRSHPPGASIFINGQRHNDLTPAQIEEMKPGTYRVEVRMQGCYPWEKDLVILPNMVTKADRIVLFPLTQQIKPVSEREMSYFFVSDKKGLYCMSSSGFFRMNLDGTNPKRLSSYSKWPSRILQARFAPDDKKFIYFNESTVWAVYLNIDIAVPDNEETIRVEELITTSDPIINVFWYSESNYVIVVTNRDIKVVELGEESKRNSVSLYKFNRAPQNLYYDSDNDSLYFTDAVKDADWRRGNKIYKLDLRQKFLNQFMKLLLKREGEEKYESR